MADKLTRAELEISAKGAKEFTTSMKEISAATKEAYSELKLAQSQYDKNTSVTKKLADRQKYLQTVTEEYTKKEEILKRQLEEMENAEERDEAAISKKKAELNNCQTQLNKYKSALEDVNKQISTHSAQLQEWGNKLKAVGGQMKDVGDSMTKYVTAPIMAAGAASVVAWKEVDEGLDIVTKKTGATGEALEDMQNRARNIAKTMPTDFATAGAAIGEVNTRFGLTGQELEDLSVQFIKFAELNETDVSTAIDNVQSMMAAWGVETENAGLMLDLLTKASQDSGASVDTLSQQLMSNKTALDDMGLSLDQSVDLLANCEKNGIDVSTMLTGLKTAMKNAAQDGKSSAEALAELQDSIMNAGSDAEAAQIAMELFGNKAGPAIADACREGRLSLEDLGYSMEDIAGTTEGTFEAIQDPLDQMTPIINTLKDTGAQIVTDLGPAIVEILGKISEGVSALNTWWSGLDESQKNIILTMVGLVAALGPVLSIVGSVITTIGSLVSIMGAASAGGGVMATVIAALTGPVGWVVAAIAALIAIGVALYKNWDTICEWAANMKEKVVAAWESLKSNVISRVENIKSTVLQKFEAIKSGIQEKIEAAKEKVRAAIDKIKGFFNFKWELPKIKLPHFSIDGSFSLNPPSIPHFSVDWYAQGGVFDAPKIIGVGEAGPEAVVPLDKLWDKLDAMTQAIVQSNAQAAAEMAGAVGETSITIGNREFARILREHGAIT